MKKTKLLIAAMFVMSPFAAQAVPIEVTIDFDGLAGGSGTVGAFSYSGLNTTGSVGNCPAAPGVEPRCAQFNMNTVLMLYLTAGGEFDLIDFYWRSTGQQTNSDQMLGYRKFGDLFEVTFGNLPGSSQGIGDTVHQIVNLEGITKVLFSNNSNSNTRIDNITFSYDDGCQVDCDPPVSIPEPGTLALLGMGLLGIGLSRRRKLAL